MRRGRKKLNLTKVVDEVSTVRSPAGSVGLLREEVWSDDLGQVVRYNLAYIDHVICQVDNGSVLGYDNAHGFHERHCMGLAEEVTFVEYDCRFEEFLAEVHQWRTKA